MVKIRLSRFGSKHNPHYRIVVTDARRKRDGAYLESLGYYDPRKTTPDWLKVNVERARYWPGWGLPPRCVTWWRTWPKAWWTTPRR